MTHDAGQNGSRHARFSEADLLAWVEDELPRARHAEMEAALSRHPEVAQLAEGMRRDRAEIRAMAEDRAPSDLMSRVAGALDTEAAPADEPAFIPVQPGVVHVRRPVVFEFFASPRGRKLALAAGLLIATGVIGLVLASVIARTPIGPTTARAPDPQPVRSTEPQTLNDTQLAGAEPSETDPVETPAPEQAEPTPVLVAAEPMTPQRAAELLAEGRLAFVITDPGNGRVAAELSRLSSASDASGRWRVRDNVSSPALVSLARSRALLTETDRGPALASDGSAPSAHVSVRPRRVDTAVFVLDTPTDAGAIEEAAAALERRLGHAPELIEIDPIELDLPRDTRDMLWWTRPVEEWDRAPIPVIVLQR